jgi:hypothetical protein
MGRVEGVRTAADIGVDVVRLEEHGLAWLQLDVVEEEDDEEADVVGELAVQSREEFGEDLAAWCGCGLAACEVLVLLLYLCKQLFRRSLDILLFRVHQTAESVFERLLQLGL